MTNGNEYKFSKIPSFDKYQIYNSYKPMTEWRPNHEYLVREDSTGGEWIIEDNYAIGRPVVDPHVLNRYAAITSTAPYDSNILDVFKLLPYPLDVCPYFYGEPVPLAVKYGISMVIYPRRNFEYALAIDDTQKIMLSRSTPILNNKTLYDLFLFQPKIFMKYLIESGKYVFVV